MIESVLNFFSKQKKDNNDCKFGIGIATTSHDFKKSYFSFPRYIENWGFYIHMVFPDSREASSAISKLRHITDQFFIDGESKKDDFSSSDIIKNFQDIDFKKIYPNNITINSTLDLIDDYSEKKIFIVGHGSLAFELASRLSLRGSSFYWKPSRISSSNKYKKMHKFYKDVEFYFEDMSTCLVVNCCPYKSNIFDDISMTDEQIIIDVTGKNPLDHDKNKIRLVDISARLSHEILFSCSPNIYKDNFGSRNINGKTFISGGFPGSKGDIIVDSYLNPTYIIGISDGLGGMVERINEPYK